MLDSGREGETVRRLHIFVVETIWGDWMFFHTYSDRYAEAFKKLLKRKHEWVWEELVIQKSKPLRKAFKEDFNMHVGLDGRKKSKRACME